jgi:hypothetical protein
VRALLILKQVFKIPTACSNSGQEDGVRLRGTMLVFDRGYDDRGWRRKLNIGEGCFVSRLKDSTSYVIVETRPIVPGTNLRDEFVILASDKESTAPMRLRRIETWLTHRTTMVFVTNHLKRHVDVFDLCAVACSEIGVAGPRRAGIASEVCCIFLT